MKLSEFYRAAIAAGMANDPRGKEAVDDDLAQAKKRFDGLSGKEKEFFDAESLTNPYSDSRILAGTGQEEIASLLVGIDIEPAEVLLADRLRSQGRKVDLVLGHHPAGRALAALADVMKMQADILNRMGVPISTAEALLDDRMKQVERRLMPGNHTRAPDAARLLGLPMMCLHTPCDNMVHTFLCRLVDKERPRRVSDVVDLLYSVPEYQDGARNGAGPSVVLGSKSHKAGKVFVDMTGGTSGSKDIFKSMSTSGIDTIVCMHISDEHRDEAKKAHINVVIAGHIASDTLGVNLLLDEVAKAAGHPLDVIECSGFKRHAR
jgi:putative NIF3 family GTP cyclohydrolase 1 type 2